MKINMLVLRDASNKAINCSWSAEGLHWTTDNSGTLVMFKNAKYVNGQVQGEMSLNNKYSIKPFKTEHFREGSIKYLAEQEIISKAFRMGGKKI